MEQWEHSGGNEQRFTLTLLSNGYYKIALVIDNDGNRQDFHWYRQNPDGTWSHKRGQGIVNNLDASGKIIYDPATADRNYSNDCNYTVFAGYYMVTAMSDNV